jgi:diguanylate cyclase
MTDVSNTSPTAHSGVPQTLPPFLSAPRPGMDFKEASAAVVDYLKSVLPMGFWAVTRFDGLRQLYVEVRDDSYGVGPGGSHLWEDSFCINMVAGEAPMIAPDAMAVPVFATAGVAEQLVIGSYVGVPITLSDGELFGTLCGLDPAQRSHEILQNRPLLDTLGQFLSTILNADLERARQARKLERVERDAETDELTGLLNRRGWDRYMKNEEDRFMRFGDPGGVIIIDVDRPKGINDTHVSQASADSTIKLAAGVIRDTVHDIDFAARLGDREFGMIVTNTLPAARQGLVLRLFAGFQVAAGVGASIGHAPFTISDGFAGAVAEADFAMCTERQRRRFAPLGH